MEGRSVREIQTALAKPFAPEDLEWRPQQVFEDSMRGLAVPYVTNRAIQNRLDEVVGPENWYNDYKPWHGTGKKEAQLCGISIYIEGRGFITKWDGAEDSDIEPVKGGLSDSMKRAAVQWGVGRILYSMPPVFVDVEKKGKSYVIKSKEHGKLDQAYLSMLKSLGLTPAPAGGLQSILSPMPVEDNPRSAAHTKATGSQALPGREGSAAADTRPGGPVPREAPKASPATGISAETAVQAQEQDRAMAYEYIVCSAKIQKGMNAQNTLVVLENAEQKRTSAFARGLHPALQPGVKLCNVRLAMRTQDTVVFYVLEDYRVLEGTQQAA